MRYLIIAQIFLTAIFLKGSYVQSPPQALSTYTPEQLVRIHNAATLLFDLNRRADSAVRYASRAVSLQELTTASVALVTASDFINNKAYMIERSGYKPYIEQMDFIRKKIGDAYNVLLPRLHDAQKIIPSTY